EDRVTKGAAREEEGRARHQDRQNQASAAFVGELIDRRVSLARIRALVARPNRIVWLNSVVFWEEVGVVAVGSTDRRLGGRWIELDPAEAREVDLRPCEGVAFRDRVVV